MGRSRRTAAGVVVAAAVVLLTACGDDASNADGTARTSDGTAAEAPDDLDDDAADDRDGDDDDSGDDDPSDAEDDLDGGVGGDGGDDGGDRLDGDDGDDEASGSGRTTDVLPRLVATPGRQRAGLTVDGRTRAYTAVVPDAALVGPVPVVLLFHGFGQQAATFVDATGMASTATDARWVLLAPDGVDRSFNAGPLGPDDDGCCGRAAEDDVDDVALARALVAEAAAVLGHEASAVVATGFSNGGMLSHRLGCEAADLVDAIVPASAALLVDCAPSEPVEVRHVHGSSDLVVPQSRGVDAAERWAEVLGCDDPVEDTDGDDGLEGTTWNGCDAGVAVRFQLRRRAGHDWLRGEPLDTNDVVAEVLAAIG